MPATSDALLVTGTTLPGMLPLLLDKEPDPDPPDSGTVAIFLLPSACFLLHQDRPVPRSPGRNGSPGLSELEKSKSKRKSCLFTGPTSESWHP